MLKKTLCCVLACVVSLTAVLCGCAGKDGKAKFGNVNYQSPYPKGEKTAAAIPEGIKDNDVLSGLNFIDDTTPVVIPKRIETENRKPGSPYAVDVKYDDGTGVCVAIFDVVKDFKALKPAYLLLKECAKSIAQEAPEAPRHRLQEDF